MGHGDGIPGNIQKAEHFMSPEATAILLLFFCIAIIIIIMLSVVIYKKNKTIKQQNNLMQPPLTEKEQLLIINYRKLNSQGKIIIENNCKDLTENGATRKNEDDGN